MDRRLAGTFAPQGAGHGAQGHAPGRGMLGREGRGATRRPQDFINLFLAETFINRSRGED